VSPRIDGAPTRGPGRATVLGATGFVGSSVVRQFLDDGWDVTAIVRDARPVAWVADALQGAQIAKLPDALDGDAVGALLRKNRSDVVVNCIGALSGSGFGAPRVFADANITAVAVLLDACVRADVGRAIVLGSGFEYAPASYPLNEKEPIGPTTLYGATKAAGTVIANYFRTVASLDVCVARPFSVFGPRERRNRFVPYCITAALSGRPIEMSASAQRRDYLYVEDLAEGLARLATHEGSLPQALNFAGPEEDTLIRIATIALEVVGSRAPMRAGVHPENPGDRPIFLGDSRLAREVLGWRPAHDLRSGLTKTIAWYREHRNLWEPSG
jgi:nucleoside-diphosphate-sugar epimerase